MSNLTAQQKIDLMWKRIYGVAQTSTLKSEYEEYTLRRDLVRSSDIWREDASIPEIASTVPGIVEFRDIRLIAEPSVEDNSTWVAVETYGTGITPENRLMDFIPPSIHPSYEIKVFKDAGKSQRIFNSEDETNWVFDYSSGILWIPNLDPNENLTEVYLVGYQYVGAKGMNPTFSGDVIDTLGELSNGDFTGGYVPGFVENQTKISDAIDLINRALNDFIPTAPSSLSDYELTMPGATFVVNDANIVLASGFTDNSGSLGSKPVPGNTVGKIVGVNLETEYVGPFGNGRTGTLSVELNNTTVGSHILTPGSDTGVYGKLEINQDVSFGTAGVSFYETLIARAVHIDFPLGLNGLSLKHTVSGSTSTLFLVRDSLSSLPTITSSNVTEGSIVNLEYSSGIPHYARGSRLTLAATVNNLATDLYLDTRNVEFSTNQKTAGSNVWAYPSAYGLPVTLAKGTPYTVSGLTYTIDDTDGNLEHGSVNMKVTARNANGSVSRLDTKLINFMRGGTTTGINPVIEDGVPVENLGTVDVGFEQNAKRILIDGIGPTPPVSIEANTKPEWNVSDPLGPNEAKIVGGVLTHSKQNFTNALPNGPDYSSHADDQYATFWIQRKNVSQLNIEIEGTFSGLWVMLPGVESQPLSPNGWLNAFQAYAGWGVPGRENGSGCAIGRPAFGGSQTVTATFGYESSSNSINNLILVRFRLRDGDAITGLRFSGVAR
jgi:hypothetical protein